MANPTFVQAAHYTGTGGLVNTSSVTLTSVAAGDAILLFFHSVKSVTGPSVVSVKDDLGNDFQNIASITLPSGLTTAYAYVLFNAAAGNRTATITWAAAVQYDMIHALEYSEASVVGGYNAATGASGTALASGNLTTFGANQMLVEFGSINAASETLTLSGGYTSRQAVVTPNYALTSADVFQVTAGSYAGSFTGAVSAPWCCLVVALAAAAPAAPTNGTVVLGTNGGGGSIIGTSGGLNGTTNAMVFDAGTPLPNGGNWTSWQNPDASGDYVGIDCGAPVLCSSVLMGVQNPSIYGLLRINAALQGTNDATWASSTNLFVVNNTTLPVSQIIYGTLLNSLAIAPAAGYYRYYRLTLPAQASAPSDLEFYGSYYSGVNATCAPVAITTTNGQTGGYYDLPVSVSMSCPTTGAAIWYTTDGSTPSAGAGTSQQYTAPIIVSHTSVVQAIAVLSGLSNSRVTSASFHFPAIASTDVMYEVSRAGYRVWGIAGDRFHDPVSGLWYWYGMLVDQPGVYYYYGQGISCWSSPDLRNWTFVSNCSGIAQGLLQYNRVSVLYNSANNNYVLWVQKSLSNAMDVFTSTSPGGPWTIVGAEFTSLDGYFTQGDFRVWVDPDTSIAYLIRDSQNGPTTGTTPPIVATNGQYLLIEQLNAAYTGVSGTFGIWPNDSSANNPFGRQSEGHSFLKVGSTYYWMTSNLSLFTPGVHMYVTSSSPLGPWSATVNPFQPDSNELTDGAAGSGIPNFQTPSENFAYDTQNDGISIIPGRQGINPGTPAVIYFGDRWDLTRWAFNVPDVDFMNWRNIMLPVAVNPSTGALSITWPGANGGQWTLDSVFPPASGMPAAPSGLVVT